MGMRWAGRKKVKDAPRGGEEEAGASSSRVSEKCETRVRLNSPGGDLFECSDSTPVQGKGGSFAVAGGLGRSGGAPGVDTCSNQCSC